MGAIPSNPLTEEKLQRITEITTNVCTEFTKQYMLGYTTALIQKVKDDMNPSDELALQLKKRPESTDPLLESPANRRDGMKATDKKYEPRYLILKSDRTLEYRASKTGKLKNHMSLVGYWVYRESEEGHPYCFRLQHWHKRTYVFELENEELRDKWVNLLWYACWYNNRVLNPDPLQAEAFTLAYPATRAALGRYRTDAAGTEQEALGDLAFYEVDREILSDVRSELSSQFSGNMYDKANKLVNQTADNTIMSVVNPAWAALKKNVEELQPTLEAKIKENLGPLFEAQNQLKEKVTGIVQPILGPAVSKILTPVINKLAPALYNRMARTYTSIEEEFDKLCKEADKEADWTKAKKDMQYNTNYYWSTNIYPCVRNVWALEDDLRTVADLLPGIEYWATIKALEDQVIAFIQDAQYTYESQVDSTLDRAGAYTSTRAALVADIAAVRRNFLKETLVTIVLAPFQSEAFPIILTPIQPIGDAIPEAFKTLLDPVQLATDILTEQVQQAVETAFDAATKA